MWTRNNKVAADSPLIDPDMHEAKDTERVEKILASVSMDTFQIAQRIREGLTGDVSFRDINDQQTRNFITNVFDEVRRDAYKDVATSARRVAGLCLRAAEDLPEGHQRVVAKCLADMFDQFAGQLERREPANANT
jgi:Txe/YoeB family toxin of Txe-Axe toxin-antitoxin module